MKRYKLREEVKKYIFNDDNWHTIKAELDWWLTRNINEEALEEVPQRVELSFSLTNKVIKSTGDIYSGDLKLWEKASNGELLDIDSLDDDDFYNWMTIKQGGDVTFSTKGIKEELTIVGLKKILKQYLKEKANG